METLRLASHCGQLWQLWYLQHVGRLKVSQILFGYLPECGSQPGVRIPKISLDLRNQNS